MIAICALLAGSVFCVHAVIILHFGCSVNQTGKDPEDSRVSHKLQTYPQVIQCVAKTPHFGVSRGTLIDAAWPDRRDSNPRPTP